MKVDLQKNVLPISKAASSLAALIKRAAATGAPIVVTQKGYPTGVLLSVEAYVALARAAEQAQGARPVSPLPFTPPFSLDDEGE